MLAARLLAITIVATIVAGRPRDRHGTRVRTARRCRQRRRADRPESERATRNRGSRSRAGRRHPGAARARQLWRPGRRRTEAGACGAAARADVGGAEQRREQPRQRSVKRLAMAARTDDPRGAHPMARRRPAGAALRPSKRYRHRRRDDRRAARPLLPDAQRAAHDHQLGNTRRNRLLLRSSAGPRSFARRDRPYHGRPRDDYGRPPVDRRKIRP